MMSAAQAAACQQQQAAQTQLVTGDVTSASNALQSANRSSFTAAQQTTVVRQLLQIGRFWYAGRGQLARPRRGRRIC